VPTANCRHDEHHCLFTTVDCGLSISSDGYAASLQILFFLFYSHIVGDSHREAVEKLSSRFGLLDSVGLNWTHGRSKTRFDSTVLLVGAVGIEPTTFGLKGHCSTTELRP
jgi:hypothetical protein